MSKWEAIVNGINAPQGMSPSQWMELQGPQFKEKANSLNLESSLQDFLAKYLITEIGRSQIALTLPIGISRIKFLKEAQALSGVLHASDPEKYEADQAVWPDRLKKWQSDKGFTSSVKTALPLRVEGRVLGSERKTRQEQVEEGWNDVALKDLVVAHTAFYILTGENLFGGYVVRAASGALGFDTRGLGLRNDLHGRDYHNVSASRSLSHLI